MFFNKARKPRTNEAIQTARSSTFRRAVAVFFLWFLVVPTNASATEVAVSFRDVGYGTFGGSQLQNIGSPNSLLALPGISNVEFVQDTASGRFEAIQTGCDSQGNDVAVTIRLTVNNTVINTANFSNGSIISFLACVNWLDQPGGKVEGFGFMLPIGSSFTIDYISLPDVTFTRTASTAGTNFFADLIATASAGLKTYPFDGTSASSFIGSANFKPASLVTALNQYYAVSSPSAVLPFIQLVKTASISGDVITYTYAATNAGNVTLTNVKIAEILTAGDATTYGGTKFSGTGTAPVFGSSMVLTDATPTGDSSNTGGDLVYNSLAVGDTVTWTSSYTVTQADKDAGGVTNQAVALATQSGGVVDAVSDLSDNTGAGDNATVTTITANPAVEITKSTTSATLASATVGTVVTYAITVKNTGNVSLTNVTLTDALTSNEAFVSSTGTGGNADTGISSNTLNVGEIWTYSASYALTQADIDAGKIENVASVVAKPPVGSNVTAYSGSSGTASTSSSPPASGGGVVTIIEKAVLNVKKLVDELDLSDGIKVGTDKLYYTIIVKNDGNVPLNTVVLTDILKDANGITLSLDALPVISPASAAFYNDGTLSVGEEWQFTAEYTVRSGAIASGGVVNVAKVTAKTPANTTITAESKVGGNTTPTGEPTGTTFPGEVSGSVLTYGSAGVSGIKVRLLKLVGGVYTYVKDPTLPSKDWEVLTQPDGSYKFAGLPPGTYAVEFDNPNPGSEPTASSDKFKENANRIEEISVGAGAVEVKQDAFLVDPSGIVYDAVTYAPISGAVVRIYHQANASATPTLVNNLWLDTVVGDANGVTTGADGKYKFYLKPASAQDGIYSLRAFKNGYVFVSQLIPPQLGPYVPALGGGVVSISRDSTTSSTMDTTYYTSFQMVFDALDINKTSNGVVQNHLPMDPSDSAITSEIEDDLREILKDDLAATMTQQSRQMSGFASGASDRLKSRDQNTCSADIAAILQANQVHFATASAVILPESAETLDAIAEVLATCPDARFEVAGHTDDRSSDAYNLGLSSARAAAVVAELKIRGVAMSQLASKGYGESRPIADNATDEGRMLNRRVEFVPLDAVAEADPCANSVVLNRDLDANSADGGQTIAGRFTREYRDCEIDGWRIFSGSAGYLSNDQGIAQGMFSLNYRVERFVDQDTVSGWFTGLYSSNDQISDLATGSINGFGLNGGVYGATRLQDNVIADYYLGLAAGIHNFDLDFDRTNGAVNAKGFYTYSALFAGSAISGELSLGKTVLSPRLGFDAAWSPGGEADITASRAGIEETGSLSTGEVSGLRLYGELQFVDLMVDQPEVLSFTPRIFCDRPIGEAGNVCGYGGKLEFSSPTDASGRQSSLIWDAEGSESHEYYSLTLNIGRQIFGGSLDTSATVSQDGDVSAKIGYSSKF